jgi:hypothetical protein
MFTASAKTLLSWLLVSIVTLGAIFVLSVINSGYRTYRRINSDYRIRPYE